MSSTRELVVRVLESDTELRTWFENKHGFHLEKAKTAELTRYEDYVSAILLEGLGSGVIARSEMAGGRGSVEGLRRQRRTHQ